ncbi:hypothetical protein TYRP_011663 [Tyrophagus putrescentiae]|nr:hypothetical protein TYRP_011663 [Tyrophagus putrescentiae]
MNSPNNSPFNSLFGHHMFCFRLQPLAVQHGFNVAICLEGLYVSSSNLNLDQLQLNADNSYLAHHPLIIFTMATFPFFSSTVLWCTCLMSVFAAYVDLTLYFSFYWLALPAWANSYPRYYSSGTERLKGKIWANPAVKFDKVSMGEGFSALSTQLRTRLVLYSAAAEMSQQWPFSFACPDGRRRAGASALRDRTAIRQCFFLMHLVSLVSYLSGQYCAELIDQLRSLMDIIKSRNKQIKGEQQQQQQVYRTLDFLHAEYWTMLRLSRHCDQR